MNCTLRIFFFVILIAGMANTSRARERYNFNPGWLLKVGDFKDVEKSSFNDSDWKKISLPHAFNEDEAFKVSIAQMTDTVAWYRKHFSIPLSKKRQKVFLEFEGVRQGADFYLNGHHIGLHENGVMAVGFDITPYVKFGKENVIAVRVDNSWSYKEKATGSRFQWNDRNFNANYGGIPKNVWLHIVNPIYQTLPLYSNLGTVGTYIYATNINVKSRTAIINAESEIKNESSKASKVNLVVKVYDDKDNEIANFMGEPKVVKPGEFRVLKAASQLSGLKFWSWGYGYLYKVKTILNVDNKAIDEMVTMTGFRKTRFGNGKIWINDRVLQMKGYAQRSSNEWPGVGMSVPPWMSDYSNGLLVKSNGNFVRWMHVAPWKQDV